MRTMRFCCSLIAVAAFSLNLSAVEIPADWKEYDDLAAEALCHYVESGLHQDPSELVYIIHVYSTRLGHVRSRSESEQRDDDFVKQLPRMWSAAAKVALVYDHNTTIAPQQRISDLESLGKSMKTMRLLREI